MNGWIEEALNLLDDDTPCALITVTHTAGSTPREVGARMLVTGGGQWGTIGGGKLEHEAIASARALLGAATGGDVAVLQVVPLGPALGQCCGGTVELLVQRLAPEARPYLQRLRALLWRDEPHVAVLLLDAPSSEGRSHAHRLLITPAGCEGLRPDERDDMLAAELARGMLPAERKAPPRGPRWLTLPGSQRRALAEPPPVHGLPLVIFGAGHVARALVQTMAPLCWPTTWVDPRDDAFPAQLPAHVRAVGIDTPEMIIDEARPDSAFIIMTHDHGLDYSLCEYVLRRGGYRYCGLIGSRTKRARFERRMQARGMTPARLSRLTCPIGLPGLGGKAPGEVAIAVAAQLLQINAIPHEQEQELP